MKKSCFSLCLSLLIALMMGGPALAAPAIEVDSAKFDIGKIKEGTKEKVTHTFKLKNTGNDTVTIKSVKPG
ncbi:MAG: DUF1573 domain-containing protein [Chitinivibrionales bacterium]|nr:DUF1573 domain-containing protein [Chitinivibrionales bacterium]MBD3356651.1 DUF1573 domain-containing protein [Chitinivibrionales bacterium]